MGGGVALDWQIWFDDAGMEHLNTVKSHPMKVMRETALVELLISIRRASLVVGVHSGLLGWASFMEPGSALIEFLPADYALFDKHRFGDDLEVNVLAESHFGPQCSGSNRYVDPRTYTDLQCRLTGVHHGCILVSHNNLTTGGVGYTGNVTVPLDGLAEQLQMLTPLIGTA